MQTQTKTTAMTRVTLVVPGQLWEDVKRLVPAGRRSQLVTEALQTEVRRRDARAAFERARRIGDELAAKYGQNPNSVDEIAQMREELDAELTGLR
jgi:Arc/MetJ-type ribon-helix-helix transcriptional regulator